MGDRAKRTLLTRHESDLKDNGYWISLLTHLQNDLVPGKDVDCLGELVKMYEQAIVPDIYAAYRRSRSPRRRRTATCSRRCSWPSRPRRTQRREAPPEGLKPDFFIF